MLAYELAVGCGAVTAALQLSTCSPAPGPILRLRAARMAGMPPRRTLRESTCRWKCRRPGELRARSAWLALLRADSLTIAGSSPARELLAILITAHPRGESRTRAFYSVAAILFIDGWRHSCYERLGRDDAFWPKPRPGGDGGYGLTGGSTIE